MPIKVYRRPGSKIYNYRGTVAGRRLRGSTGTTDKARAERIAAEKENEIWKRRLDGPSAVLTFAKAVMLYKSAGKPTDYLLKIADYWKDTLVKDMTQGAIRQSAIDLYPDAGGATRVRQVITPTRAVINHCAELELCAPLRIKGFRSEPKIKKPVSLEWVQTFCQHARPVMRALVLQMFATAERFGEAHRTEWSDYDFQQRTVRVRDTKTGQERFAHMPAPLLVALANLPRDRRPFDWSETTLRRWWDEDVKRTAETVPAFERLTFHCCRHGFATNMLRSGVDPKTASELGGWKDISLFMRTYAHAIRDAKLTDRLFDPDLTQAENESSTKQKVIEK